MRRASARALNVSFAVLAIWTAFGCTPKDQTPPTLHVLDADGSPPAAGYALVVHSPTLQSSTPWSWTAMGDTLRWNASDGVVVSPNAHRASHWLICSPDPGYLNEWRRQLVPVSGAQDSCILPISIRCDVQLRAHRSVGCSVTGYSLHASHDHSASQLVDSSASTHGFIRLGGTISASQFPLTVALKRHVVGSTPEVEVASMNVHFDEESPSVQVHWSDGDNAWP